MKNYAYIAIFILFFSLLPGFFHPYGNIKAASLQLDKWQPSITALQKKQWGGAYKALEGTPDSIVKELVTWLYLTETNLPVDFKTVRSFVVKNPHWPLQKKLRMRAEETMPQTLRPYQVIGWFEKFPPITVSGLQRYLAALTTAGYKTKTATIVKERWPNIRLDKEQQRRFLTDYAHILTPADHIARIDNLIWSQRFTEAKRLLPYIDASYKKLATARIGLARQATGVDQLIQVVPNEMQTDPGLLYERLRWRRIRKFNTSALELLNSPPQDLGRDKLWWRERHILARRAIEEGHYRLAYKITSTHRQTGGFPLAQAEWLSGWLALRFLDEPKTAFNHFYKLHENVKTPISLSRAAYWAGRASDQLQQPHVADKWYRHAARYRTTFYGQLAATKLKQQPFQIQARHPKPTAEEKHRFESSDLVQAARLLDQLGMHNHLEDFLGALARNKTSATDYVLIASLALETGQYHKSVKVAKSASKEGLTLIKEGYPILPPHPTRAVTQQSALIHAMIRQESAFNTFAVSPAGARGLMQLMPGTAREVARKMGLRVSKSKLTRDPKYNVTLGAGYLEQMLDRYDGSYVLAIAAYNAGPGNVSRWLTANGDPRDEHIDIIDWVEKIPIYETRNYVQRVLEGLYVYQIKFDEEPPYLVAEN